MPIIEEMAPAKTPKPAQTGFEKLRGLGSGLGLRKIMSAATARATVAKTAIRTYPDTIPPRMLPMITPTRIAGAQSFRMSKSMLCFL